MKIFITGSSGFIGFHLSKRLLDSGHSVYGFDSMNNYYDIKLKKARYEILKKYNKFSFTKNNLENQKVLSNTILKFKNFLTFLEKFIKDMRVFDPEYILYSFINENKFKIKLINNFNLALIRIEDLKPTKIVFIPFKDRIQIKIAKQKIKLIKFYNKIKFINK